MIPGVSAHVSEEDLGKLDERRVDRIEAIILSMTPRERSNPAIINGSRRKRIASGSGTSVEEINLLLKQLEETRKGMKQLSKMRQRMGKFGGRRR
jgi:signal recognition particle subunit SRP54